MTTTPREATRPRLLIEEWLPAKALGVECMRERGASSALPPLYFLHVWWARRPLVVSRAAVLASLLPAGFDRAGFGTADSYKAFFERLLGFYASSDVIALNASYLEAARRQEGNRIANPHGPRAFNHVVRYKDVEVTNEVISDLWGESSIVIDPMAGGGSIPFEASRLGLPTVANELNPVACSVLEATVDYPLRFGQVLADKAHAWSREWLRRFRATMDRYYESTGAYPAWSYIFARTVPCPDTGHPTPLVPDWHLMKKKGGKRVVAEPVVLDATKGTWTVRIREVGQYAGQLRQPPPPTYQRGKGFSLFTRSPISDEYIKATAQRGEMESVLYAVVLKTPQGIDFRPAEKTDVDALEAAE
ncbi:DUF1156 domain-containing protein, partial [Candidatus Poribacteria bacterium]|nr:DUF1156 domain-containing protein [Candidatus Poribacteria bacterium]